MKALVYTDPREVIYRDEPDPSPGPGDLVVRVDAVGICGSDMHAYLGHDARRVPPLILGHEAAGSVVEGAAAGRRGVINPLVACGECDDCLGGRANICTARKLIGLNYAGAFAERVAVPEQNLIPIPDDMDAAHAALTEPAATALHAVALAGRASWRPLDEAEALVIGGGSIGLLTALMLAHRGCRRIVLAETNPLRRETARRAGAFQVVDPTTDGVEENHFDLVMDAVGGAASRRAAVSAVRPGGVIVHIGLMDNEGGMDVRKMTLSEVTFIGTYTYTPVDFRATVQKLYTGALGSLDWIEQRPLAEGPAAFDDLLNDRSAAPKIVLRPG
jgi:alcohol dehydrogenase